ncbi:DUF1428 domain-containing protein [Rhodobacter sp. 24-YEA-8]|uniref:DUF1428 domain-containing protein n=1 Tax=Rhodobacter sp. 24-YEA-8 TaxID=1884310 RepID=UPI0008998A20|nr:DUF1428 domain-containing protein [Rhodobacter sp. 24-YEA-8]SEC04146.1 Uncharacterized conserved protein YbaA, DUF1428 family [Rhodobacter sp. 24-YEA-8]
MAKQTPGYIDGFLIPVRNEDRETYRAHEAKWWGEFRALGALSLVAGWGDEVPPGKQTDFLRAVDLQDGESVVFCWMTWPDKATRDKAYAAMEARSKSDPDMKPEAMPFDGKRMVYGGFVPLLVEE